MTPKDTPSAEVEARLVPHSALMGFIAALYALLFGAGFVPRIADSAPARNAVWIAAALTLPWTLWLVARGRPFTAKVVIRASHWVQIIMHTSIFVYWGLYVDLVGETAPLILVQIPFAYLISALVAWTRGRRWSFGFGPIPIIGSVNLFLWFKDPYFHWQLVMVALAFTAKDIIQWARHGGHRHIFNPSGFALSAISIGVIAFGASEITWGNFIATQLEVAPHMFEVIFIVGVIVQVLFGVTWTTLAAAATMWIGGLLWFWIAGDWFFTDTTIPIAVFLGMNLLITDPVTSPDNAPGKALFGALYGALVFPLFVLLPVVGAPAFYDKLLQVPLCNLLAPALERIGARISGWLPAFDLSAKAQNGVAVLAWVGLFMVIRPGLIDHPGASPDEWRPLCAQGDATACVRLRHTLEKGCALSRVEICYELAVELARPEALDRNPIRARKLLDAACEAEHAPSCALLKAAEAPKPTSPTQVAGEEAACEAGDGAACLKLAASRMRGPAGPSSTLVADAFDRACRAGAPAGCVNLGLMLLRGDGVPPNPAAAVALHLKACDLGLAAACARLGVLYKQGVGGAPDLAKARAAFERGCQGGDQSACRWVMQNRPE